MSNFWPRGTANRTLLEPDKRESTDPPRLPAPTWYNSQSPSASVAAGVAVLDALDIASSSMNNTYIQKALSDVKLGVFAGEPLSVLYKKWPAVFDVTFSSMVAVGERTGKMDDMYNAIAKFYEEETEESVAALTEMLEPIMIVFMGGTIGFILVAMYTPMFKMGEALGV